jgi:hypothetical protein
VKASPRSLRALRAVTILALLWLSACLSTGQLAGWGAAIADEQRTAALRDLPPDASRTLIPLSEIFYARITSRRFNSRATFEDPSMRQFFPTVASYSDYYAALVDALELANIRFARPTEVELLEITTDPSGSLRLSLRFVGRNDLPLRWWNAVLLRTDEWRWEEGRWWVVPGKI